MYNVNLKITVNYLSTTSNNGELRVKRRVEESAEGIAQKKFKLDGDPQVCSSDQPRSFHFHKIDQLKIIQNTRILHLTEKYQREKDSKVLGTIIGILGKNQTCDSHIKNILNIILDLNRLEDAIDFFEKLKCKFNSFNSKTQEDYLLKELVKRGNLDNIMHYFECMRRYSASNINYPSYSLFINSLISNSDENKNLFIEKVLFYFEEMKRCFVLKCNIYNDIIFFLIKNNELDTASFYLNEMKSLNIPCDKYTHVNTIKILARQPLKQDTLKQIVESFEELRDQSIPSQSTYNVFINCLIKIGPLDKVMHYIQLMEKDGWSLNDKMCTALIKACGEQGDAVSAAFYFHRQITSYGYVSHTICNMLYSTFITALGKSGWIGAAHSYFKEMLDKGIQPDLVTYTAMIDTLNHPDWNRIALEYIDLMFKKFPVITSDITYYVVIGVYVEAGKFDKAMQVAEIARFDLRLDQEHEFDCHYHSHGLACLKLYNYLSKKKNFMEISVITGIGLHSNSGQYFEMKNKIKNLINTYFPYLDIIDHGGMIRIVKYPN